MRPAKWSLVLAAVRVCTFGAVATLLAGCMSPSEGTENAPTLSQLSATPTSIAVGGAADIMGNVGSEAQSAVWTLSLGASSTALGSFSPAEGGFSANEIRLNNTTIRSTFTPTRAGLAVIVANVKDEIGQASATVNVTVTAAPVITGPPTDFPRP